VLALVALFTGGLLVFSTHALAVVRRRSQLALLRVLGMTRRQLASLLVVEGAIVGIAGSVSGWPADSFWRRLRCASRRRSWRGILSRRGTDAFALLRSPLRCSSVSGLDCDAGGARSRARRGARRACSRAQGRRRRASLSRGFVLRGRASLPSRWVRRALFFRRSRVCPCSGYFAIALLLIGTLMLMPRIAVMVLALLPLPGAASAATGATCSFVALRDRPR
jgi:putative ABC transport system permease protein